jgi:hypothetical protein
MIDKRAPENSFRVATDVGSSHHHDFLSVPFLYDPGNLQGFPMIRGKRGGNSKNIGPRFLNLLSDFGPIHPEMVITGIELEGASIIQGIEIFKIREFRGNGN